MDIKKYSSLIWKESDYHRYFLTIYGNYFAIAREYAIKRGEKYSFQRIVDEGKVNEFTRISG